MATKFLLSNLIGLASLSIAYGVVNYSIHNFNTLHVNRLFEVNSLGTVENKLVLLSFVGLYIATVLMCLIVSIMLFRLFSGIYSPNQNKDPAIIAVINRVVTNTIEQSFLFFGLFVFWLFNRYSNNKLKEGLLYPFLFLFARALYASGYILGTIVGFVPLRAPGFALGIIVLSILASQSYGVSVLKYFE